jgi:hypothetical protein
MQPTQMQPTQSQEQSQLQQMQSQTHQSLSQQPSQQPQPQSLKPAPPKQQQPPPPPLPLPQQQQQQQQQQQTTAAVTASSNSRAPQLAGFQTAALPVGGAGPAQVQGGPNQVTVPLNQSLTEGASFPNTNTATAIEVPGAQKLASPDSSDPNQNSRDSSSPDGIFGDSNM